MRRSLQYQRSFHAFYCWRYRSASERGIGRECPDIRELGDDAPLSWCGGAQTVRVGCLPRTRNRDLEIKRRFSN